MLLLLLSLCQEALCQESTDPPASAAHHLAQAQLFMRKRWYADAAEELRAALAAPGGGDNYMVYVAAAGVAFEIQDIEWAIEMAQGAAATAPSEAERQAAADLADSYAAQFGFLTVDAPYPGMASRLQLESTSLILDPELQRFINQVALRWRGKTALPVRIGLPVGSYLVNGQPVTLTAGGEHTLPLPMSALGSRALTALQVTRLEIAGGASALLGAQTSNLLPSLQLQLSLTQPIGPVLLGVLVEGGQASYIGERNILQDSSAWAAGVRLGYELQLASALSVRPSLLGRYSVTPGISLTCSGDPFAPVCGPGSAGDRFATGTAWHGGLELSVEHREAGRTTALGTGVKLAADRAFGSIPASGEGWDAVDPSWSAFGLRLLANLSLAF